MIKQTRSFLKKSMVHASRRELVGQSARYSFHSFEIVISSGFRDFHRSLCITLTNLFDLTCFCSLLVIYFWNYYGSSNVSVGGCD